MVSKKALIEKYRGIAELGRSAAESSAGWAIVTHEMSDEDFAKARPYIEKQNMMLVVGFETAINDLETLLDYLENND